MNHESPLQRMVRTTRTELWNDSCSLEDLGYAIEHGATGATTNPTIVREVLRRERHLWRDRIVELSAEHPAATDRQLALRLMEEMAVRGAGLLAPVFEREGRKRGRLSVQTDPSLYRDAEGLVEAADRLAALAPNMQVKIPVTAAGLRALEEATARGVNVNATVCFTVPQALAVAEAVDRGLRRLEEGGGDPAAMAPVCTIMVGRLDDWLRVVASKQGLVLTPGTLDWAGVACLKRAYGIFGERGYRSRLLAAAYRNHLHWSELVGGDLVLTMPCDWQRLFNGSDIEVRERIDDPVPAPVLAELGKLVEFRRAYEPDGLLPGEMDRFGATRRTLRGFIGSVDELASDVRDVVLPDPDAE